jgi:hypothetical protein
MPPESDSTTTTATPDTATQTTTTSSTDTSSDSTADLGDAGRRALAAERTRANDAERIARTAEQQRVALEAELEKLRDASRSESEKAIEKARKEAGESARKEVLAAANRRILTAEIRAAAGGKLADPLDAVRLLNVADFSVNDDGEVDHKAIDKAIDSLLDAKPYLAANAKRVQGTADGGARQINEDANITPGMGRLVAGYSQTKK